MREGRERDGELMGVEGQWVVSMFCGEEVLLCSGGWCPQPAMNGHPGQGSREGRVSESSLLILKIVVQAGRECEKMGIWAKEGWKG